MNDPSSASQAPPPRYLLESDSSDEEGQGAYPSTSRKPARARPTHDVSVQFIDQVGDVGCIAVSVGQAGRYLDRMTGARKAIGEVTSLGEVVGRALRVDGDLLLVMEEGEQSEGIYAVADKIVQTVKARSWLVVSTYLPSMYIPDPSSQPSISSTPPIRHLRTSGSTPSSGSVAAFDSPNYVTGLPAALESIIIHPASPLPPNTQLDLLLLPLPLSSLSPVLLASTLSKFAPSLIKAITRPSAAVWDEDDDEPFSAPGMGGGRRSHGTKKGQGLEREGLGMYT